MNPLVPLLILLLVPLSVIGAVLYTDPGIEPALFYMSVKTFVILAVVGGALAFVANRLSERGEG